MRACWAFRTRCVPRTHQPPLHPHLETPKLQETLLSFAISALPLTSPLPPSHSPLQQPGGEGAPELQETLLNFTINAGALSLLGLLVYRDVSSQARDQAMIQREEELGRLQVRCKHFAAWKWVEKQRVGRGEHS